MKHLLRHSRFTASLRQEHRGTGPQLLYGLKEKLEITL
jgi:hypothetical protein